MVSDKNRACLIEDNLRDKLYLIWRGKPQERGYSQTQSVRQKAHEKLSVFFVSVFFVSFCGIAETELQTKQIMSPGGHHEFMFSFTV